MARPTAMPIMRATVTTAEAVPNARRPTASTAAAERAVTVRPNPSPKIPSASATVWIVVLAVQFAIHASAAAEPSRPVSETRVDEGQADKAGRKGGAEQDGSADVDASGSGRGLPLGARRPSDREDDDSDRDVEVEDPPPGGCEEIDERPCRDPRVGEA